MLVKPQKFRGSLRTARPPRLSPVCGRHCTHGGLDWAGRVTPLEGLSGLGDSSFSPHTRTHNVKNAVFAARTYSSFKFPDSPC